MISINYDNQINKINFDYFIYHTIFYQRYFNVYCSYLLIRFILSSIKLVDYKHIIIVIHNGNNTINTAIVKTQILKNR